MTKTDEAVFNETFRQLCGHDPDEGFLRMEQVTNKTCLPSLQLP